VKGPSWNWVYVAINCSLGSGVFCTLHDPGKARRQFNVRMSAAFTLMTCLVIKAIHMCALNWLGRGKLKEHCLTFGDVLVAAAFHSELRVQGCESYQHSLLITANKVVENAWSMPRTAFDATSVIHVTSIASIPKSPRREVSIAVRPCLSPADKRQMKLGTVRCARGGI
jgi:hypothetical protein